jgi:hypothetical protein
VVPFGCSNFATAITADWKIFKQWRLFRVLFFVEVFAHYLKGACTFGALFFFTELLNLTKLDRYFNESKGIRTLLSLLVCFVTEYLRRILYRRQLHFSSPSRLWPLLFTTLHIPSSGQLLRSLLKQRNIKSSKLLLVQALIKFARTYDKHNNIPLFRSHAELSCFWPVEFLTLRFRRKFVSVWLVLLTEFPLSYGTALLYSCTPHYTYL